LKIGLQADNFRVHCNIGADKWIGVDMLMTSKSFLKKHISLQKKTFSDNRHTEIEKNLDEISGEYKGVKMLDITSLLQTKLMSFAAARTASRDSSDIMYLVEKYSAAIDASMLDQTQIDYFLENAELEAKGKGAVRRVLKC
jgi:hypothetical protein